MEILLNPTIRLEWIRDMPFPSLKENVYLICIYKKLTPAGKVRHKFGKNCAIGKYFGIHIKDCAIGT